MNISRIVDECLIDTKSHSYKLSPNGLYLSYFKVIDNKTFFVLSLAEEKTLISLPNNYQCYDYYWNNNSKYIFFIGDIRGNEKQTLLMLDIEKAKSDTNIRVISINDSCSTHLIHISHTDPNIIYISSRDLSALFPQIYKYNIRDDSFLLCDSNTINAKAFYCDDDDKLRLALRCVNGKYNLLWFDSKKGWVLVHEISQLAKLRIAHIKSSGEIYLLTDSEPREYCQLIKINVYTGLSETIISDESCDITDAFFSKNKLIWVEYDKSKENYICLDNQAKTFFSRVQSSINKNFLKIRSVDNNFKKAVIDIVPPEKKPSTLLIDFSIDSSPAITILNEDTKEHTDYLSFDSKTIRARDGILIEYHIYKTKDHDPNKPLIIFVHGGPIGVKVGKAYNPIIAVLVKQGFTVVAPNYRGSGGRGRTFRSLGYGEWASGMLNDIEDVTNDFLNGYDDKIPKVGILGISYGGYAAIMLSMKTPLYNACASINAPYDLLDTITHLPISWQTSKKELIDGFTGGTSQENRDKELLNNSPASFSSFLSVPALIIASKNDARVRIESVRKFVDNLRKENSSLRYCEVKEEGHVIKSLDSSRMILIELSEWFSRFLPGDIK